MKKNLEPKNIRVVTGDEAWMYQNPKSIDVCIFQKGKGTLVARVTKKQLEEALNETNHEQQTKNPKNPR